MNREIQAEMCRESKQHLFPINREGFNVTIFRPGTRRTPVSSGGVVVIVQFIFFRPHKAGDKAVAVEGSKGQSPRVTDTHTHQNTSSELQTSIRDMYALMH